PRSVPLPRRFVAPGRREWVTRRWSTLSSRSPAPLPAVPAEEARSVTSGPPPLPPQNPARRRQQRSYPNWVVPALMDESRWDLLTRVLFLSLSSPLQLLIRSQ